MEQCAVGFPDNLKLSSLLPQGRGEKPSPELTHLLEGLKADVESIRATLDDADRFLKAQTNLLKEDEVMLSNLETELSYKNPAPAAAAQQSSASVNEEKQ